MKQKKPVNRETIADRNAKEKKAKSNESESPKPARRAEIKSETVLIDGYRSDGQGIARIADGRVIFIPGVIAGETVRAGFADAGERFVQGWTEEITVPAPDRIAERYPPLAEFPLGNLQFLPVERQREVKTAILRDQLTRVGKLDLCSVAITEMVESPLSWEYMTEMSFDLSDDGSILLPEAAPDDAHCPIAAAAINAVLGQFKFEAETGLRRVVFRADRDGGIQLILPGDSERPEIELETDLAISVVYVGPSAAYVLSGDSTILQEVGGISMAVSESSACFLNPGVYTPLFERLNGLLPPVDGKNALIVHPGLGLWVKWAAARGAFCAAVIEDENETDDFLLNMEDETMADRDVSLYIGYPDQVLSASEQVPDWVIADLTNRPLHVNTVDTLGRLRPDHLLVVGDDAATAARDLARLVQAGFTLKAAVPFDLAPQTATFGCVYYLTGKA